MANLLFLISSFLLDEKGVSESTVKVFGKLGPPGYEAICLSWA